MNAPPNYGPGAIIALPPGVSPAQAQLIAQQQTFYSAQLAAQGALANARFAEPLENAGIRVGEITAWRCWAVAGDFLRSVAMDKVWAPDEPMEGRATDYGGEGVHAWKTQSGALTYGAGMGGGGLIYGKVALWGDVIEHEEGYRAQYAKILSLDGIIGKQYLPRGILRQLQERYGVAVTAVESESWESLAAQFTPPKWERVTVPILVCAVLAALAMSLFVH